MSKTEAVVMIFAIAMFMALLGSPVACTIHRQQVIAEAIKNGADPLEVQCAIDGDIRMRDACMALVMRKK